MSAGRSQRPQQPPEFDTGFRMVCAGKVMFLIYRNETENSTNTFAMNVSTEDLINN